MPKITSKAVAKAKDKMKKLQSRLKKAESELKKAMTKAEKKPAKRRHPAKNVQKRNPRDALKINPLKEKQ